MGTELLIKTGSFVNVSSDVTQKWSYHTETRDLRKSFFKILIQMTLIHAVQKLNT